MDVLVIADREIRLGLRNPWAYTFLVLFSLFSVTMLAISAQSQMDGYTNTTATTLNLTLYLLPLMSLLFGSFSVTAEKEDGGWELLASYPLSAAALLAGKFLGLAAVLFVITSFGFGITGLAGALAGKAFSIETFFRFVSFSIWLITLFLGLSLLVGAISANRWQALTLCVGLWFFLILAWPTLLIGFLGLLPYGWIKPVLQVLTFLNPAEFVRIYTVINMGGGSVFGAEYYRWVEWAGQPFGHVVFFLLCLLWLVLSIGGAIFLWERGRYRG